MKIKRPKAVPSGLMDQMIEQNFAWVVVYSNKLRATYCRRMYDLNDRARFIQSQRDTGRKITWGNK